MKWIMAALVWLITCTVVTITTYEGTETVCVCEKRWVELIPEEH